MFALRRQFWRRKQVHGGMSKRENEDSRLEGSELASDFDSHPAEYRCAYGFVMLTDRRFDPNPQCRGSRLAVTPWPASASGLVTRPLDISPDTVQTVILAVGIFSSHENSTRRGR
jgi:hypothetical protein